MQEGRDARKLFENAELSGENSKLRKVQRAFDDWSDSDGRGEGKDEGEGEGAKEKRWVRHVDEALSPPSPWARPMATRTRAPARARAHT